MKKLKVAAVGLAHEHIYGQLNLLLNQGAEIVAVFDEDAAAVAKFSEKYPTVKIASSEQEVLNDRQVDAVVTAAIPAQRAAIAARALLAGKNVFCDKPGFIEKSQLQIVRDAVKTSGKRFLLYYQMRNSGLVWEMRRRIRAGDIGTVAQIVSFGPHKCKEEMRPDWHFDASRGGSVLVDLGTHHLDLHMLLVDAQDASLQFSRLDRLRYTDYPAFYDYGEALFSYNGGSVSGLLRVDWLTPDGLAAHGDGRVMVIGSEGYFDYRPSIELAGREGHRHLFVVNRQGTMVVGGADVGEASFANDVYLDLCDGGERSMSQEGVFRTASLLLDAEAAALDGRKR